MRRARKECGAWLIRKQNEEISQFGGRDVGRGHWHKAFRAHRDFWKPVYEAEREARVDVRPAKEQVGEEGWEGVASSVLGRRHPLQSKPKTATRASVAAATPAAPASRPSAPALSPTLRQAYQEAHRLPRRHQAPWLQRR